MAKEEAEKMKKTSKKSGHLGSLGGGIISHALLCLGWDSDTQNSNRSHSNDSGYSEKCK